MQRLAEVCPEDNPAFWAMYSNSTEVHFISDNKADPSLLCNFLLQCVILLHRLESENELNVTVAYKLNITDPDGFYSSVIRTGIHMGDSL